MAHRRGRIQMNRQRRRFVIVEFSSVGPRATLRSLKIGYCIKCGAKERIC
uniref:Uncharacterized protein n=1 Tax=Parascaris equorum TaxID=6256 RepID=A0A914RE17_PAREQ